MILKPVLRNVNESGEGVINVRIYSNAMSVYMNLKIKVKVEYFDARVGQVKPSRPNLMWHFGISSC